MARRSRAHTDAGPGYGHRRPCGHSSGWRSGQSCVAFLSLGGSMAPIFIRYRREDSQAYAGRLAGDLKSSLFKK